MTIAFKNFGGAMVTGGTTFYTCPALTKARVNLCQVANVDGVNSADASVHWTDSSDSARVTYLAKLIAVPGKSSVSVLTGTLNLETGDTIVGVASADSDLQLSGSLTEIS